MSNSDRSSSIERAVLALVARRISMAHVMDEGFTSGQVMRELLRLEDAGMILNREEGLALTEGGAALLQGAPVPKNDGDWIVPLAGVKVRAKLTNFEPFIPGRRVILD